MVTEDDLERARAAEGLVRESYLEARRHREGLEVRHACEKWGVCIGAVVVDDMDQRGTVLEVQPWNNGRKPWLFVKGIKKDGSVEEREFRMCSDWTVVSE